MQELSLIFSIAILIMSVVAHELSHGYAADSLGDPTARMAGRLTLNPVSHLDMLGSIIVPTLSYLAGGFIFGWAKPVPYNPYNLRGGRFGEAFVAAAGALMNIFLALFLGLVLRFWGSELPASFVDLASTAVFINILLAIFNLVPIPPLDGSKVLFSLLPFHAARGWLETAERFSIPIFLFFVFFLWKFFVPVVFVIFTLIVGS